MLLKNVVLYIGSLHSNRGCFLKVASWMILSYLATQRSEEGKDGDGDNALVEKWSNFFRMKKLIILRRTGKKC